MDGCCSTRRAGKSSSGRPRELLELDTKPCEAFLIVEFLDGDTDDKLAELARRDIGIRKLICRDPASSF